MYNMSNTPSTFTTSNTFVVPSISWATANDQLDTFCAGSHLKRSLEPQNLFIES